MKLNCKRIDFTYTPGEEIFNFPEESGLPFLFDVEEELTADSAAMDAVGEILDLSFNPEITDELLVVYFDLNQEIFCITHES